MTVYNNLKKSDMRKLVRNDIIISSKDDINEINYFIIKDCDYTKHKISGEQFTGRKNVTISIDDVINNLE